MTSEPFSATRIGGDKGYELSGKYAPTNATLNNSNSSHLLKGAISVDLLNLIVKVSFKNDRF